MPEVGVFAAQPFIKVLGGVGFQNSFTDSGINDPTAYRLLPALNAVEVRADLTVPTFAADANIFRLPVGLRPNSGQSFPVVVITTTGTVGAATPRVYVQTSGQVTADHSSIPGASTGLTTRMHFGFYLSLDW